ICPLCYRLIIQKSKFHNLKFCMASLYLKSARFCKFFFSFCLRDWITGSNYWNDSCVERFLQIILPKKRDMVDLAPVFEGGDTRKLILAAIFRASSLY